jgi:hypothetical protein
MEELEKLTHQVLADYEVLLNVITKIDSYDLLSLKTELSEKALADIKKVKRQKISIKQYIDKQENIIEDVLELNRKTK